ncbi:MAG: hypothetical protein ACXABY_24915 [Candidatus Thorarchaeota archaeon]|jgi:hypothetical protein
MILEFNDDSWIDVDSITAMVKEDNVIVTTEAFQVSDEDYKVILTAFKWRHPIHYKKDMTRGDR